MSTTFVRVGDYGFWMGDGVLEVWLRLLALHVAHQPDSSVATEIRDRWLLASGVAFMGCVPDGLAEAVATPEGAALVRGAIHSLMTALSGAPSHLSKDMLNLMGLPGGPFTADFETRRLVEVGQAFLDLLDGKIQSGPRDTSFMPGS